MTQESSGSQRRRKTPQHKINLNGQGRVVLSLAPIFGSERKDSFSSRNQDHAA